MAQILQICNELPNVGDRLASYITERMFGLEVVRVFKNLPHMYIDKPVLAGLGSCLGYYGELCLHVWGTGYEPGYIDTYHRNNPGSRSRWVVHAVRGHVTRAVLKLGTDTVIGDPAILLPRIYHPTSCLSERVRYFLHFDNHEIPDDVEADEFVSTKMNPFKVIDLIVSSDFVFTEALHVAILAYAYGVPWAWSINHHIRGMVKWYDWFSSIEIEGRCFQPTEIQQARNWYDHVHHGIKTLDSDSLISSFPNQIAF